jgi:protein phosphatase
LADQPNIPAVEIAFRTDPGRDPDKQVNEDAAIHVEAPLGLLAVVCDGMGGHAGGKEASELATKTIVEIVQAAPLATSPRDALRVAIEEANRRVWSMPTNEEGYRPGSTVVTVLIHAAGAELAHVGDSRIYLLHAGAITQVTKDHSMVQEMVDRHLLKAEDAANHPDANKIMRALGIAKEVEVELRPQPVAFAAGDVFILCSDGLSDLVEASEILEIAGSCPAKQAAGQLVDLANARGGHDNITALVMRMKASAQAQEAPTLLKTIPLTAHEPLAVGDHAVGPRGTLLAAPAPSASAGGPAVAVRTALAAPVALPVAQFAESPRPVSQAPGSLRGDRSKLPVILGIVLAVVALGVAGAALYLEQRPRHRDVRIVELDASRPRAPDDDASVTAPDVTLAPVLAPPSGVKVPWWKDPDAASPTGENRDCVQARWQRAHGRPAASYEPLEARCRAAGGNP